VTERGSITTEVTLIVPALLCLLLLVVIAGRVAGARNALVAVARDAARAASLETDPQQAYVAAERLAREALSGTECAEAEVKASVRPGSDGHMRGGVAVVEVHCNAAISDLALLSLPGSVDIHANGTEVIDRYQSAP